MLIFLYNDMKRGGGCSGLLLHPSVTCVQWLVAVTFAPCICNFIVQLVQTSHLPMYTVVSLTNGDFLPSNLLYDGVCACVHACMCVCMCVCVCVCVWL